MIRVENLSFEVPVKELYRKISFEIKAGEHCGLIGSNGVGKSTLVNMICHPDDYLYDGKIIKENCRRIGYAHQQAKKQEEETVTVWEFLTEEFVGLQLQMEEICAQMGEDSQSEEIFDKYQQVLDLMDAVDYNNYENNIKKQLSMISLEHLEENPVSSISGGEYKLLQMLKEMIFLPDFLILDEPDAFLDFGNIDRLRKLINSYKGTLLVITHNRDLLNHCFNKILHLENKILQEFEGNYTEYQQTLLLQKIDRKEQTIAEQQEIERTEKMVDRMQKEASRADIASLGRALHAKQTHLERLRKRAIQEPFLEIHTPEIILPQVELNLEESKKTLLQVENYSLEFDEMLLEQVSFQIEEGEKIALVGPNGSGKTTLLHHIFQGNHSKIHKSLDCKIGFLSQREQEIFREENTVEEEMKLFGLELGTEREEYLKQYRFDREILKQKINCLSGGEKNLLQLLKIQLSEANLLLLDEPTSHLDTHSQIALEKAIAGYQGAVFMVTHDFNTIVNCADYVLLVEDKSIRKVRMRTFRKMIYEQYFSKEYLELADKKKDLESRIIRSLWKNDIQTARKLWDDLDRLIVKMKEYSNRR